MARIPPRYEFKYVVSRDACDRIRDIVSTTCALDPYCEDREQHRYTITSLYLDGPDLPFHRARVDRAPRRLKLRVRFYPDAEGAGAFLEVKRRAGDVIIKRRQRILPAETWADRLRGDGLDLTPVEDDFRATLELYDARPVAFVQYQREAWVSFVDEYARVTFDTAIEYQPHDRWDLEPHPQDWRSADDPATFGVRRSEVLLELKFADRIPGWMAALGQRLDLFRRGYSKYCTAIEHLYGRDRGVTPGRRVSRLLP